MGSVKAGEYGAWHIDWELPPGELAVHHDLPRFVCAGISEVYIDIFLLINFHICFRLNAQASAQAGDNTLGAQADASLVKVCFNSKSFFKHDSRLEDQSEASLQLKPD